jgi:DNA-binding NarL/FixJ family response regulator
VLADAVRHGRGPAETGFPSYLAFLLREAEAKPDTRSAQVAASNLAEPLTAREVEILRLIAAGLRNQEIADRLFISLSTVKRHIANAYGKLDVDHRTEAVARATELNLLSAARLRLDHLSLAGRPTAPSPAPKDHTS